MKAKCKIIKLKINKKGQEYTKTKIKIKNWKQKIKIKLIQNIT